LLPHDRDALGLRASLARDSCRQQHGVTVCKPAAAPARLSLKPISNTAFYCCGIRMRDAERPRPICGDQFAKLFMNEQGLEIFRRFAAERGPNVSNVGRARYIDDLLRARLRTDPQLQVLLIGCGFDSRAFRLSGGEWFELDEPQLIEYKNQRLPATQAANPLLRIPIDFATESLAEKLAPLSATRPTVVIIEGVTMYVTSESLRATLEALKARVPSHEVIADLMTRTFLNTYGPSIKAIIAQLGADMIPDEHPERAFELAGYRQVSSQPIAAAAFEYRGLRWLSPLMRRVFPGLFAGYTVRVFESPAT
jgi:methyltransferase (TIGR00027 family)